MKRPIRHCVAGISFLLAMLMLFGCAAPSVEHMVDYQIIGERSVKYIVVPAEKSQAGSMYLDSNVSLEICDIEPLSAGAVSEEDEDSEGAAKGVEKRCRQSRVLRTQEYR